MLRSNARAALFATSLVIAATFSPSNAAAKGPKQQITKIEIRAASAQDDAKRLEKQIRESLQKALKKAHFGKTNGKMKEIELSARLLEWTSVIDGDVARVSCVLQGHVAGGQTARARISFGGDPKKHAELEKQVIEMVSAGVVARLAQTESHGNK
jgi:hypothetical protein